ncbi:helix-turn-helix domain-containing protein [Paenibacillus gansuensis]|uniref:Helix-turn-helix domain-containing protein n=1 Tax=Paenibacillus gansuensis TaxID=306542 RepID=A0ABW5PIU1_9BACL
MIGARIKKLRQMKGYSISELADLAGVSKSYISYIERELQKNPSLQMLTKIAVPLDTQLEDLLGIGSSSKTANEHLLDEEWKDMIIKAIEEGMSKGDFRHLKDYLRYKKWVEKKQDYGNMEKRS